MRLKAHADAADAGEQVDKAKTRRGVARMPMKSRARCRRLQQGLKCRRHARGAGRLALFPATHRLDVLADVRGDFSLCEADARLFQQVKR
jgi:hypothetical protein